MSAWQDRERRESRAFRSVRRQRPIFVSLALLVAVMVLPAVGLSAVLLYDYVRAERVANASRVENLASRIADALDRELAGMVATLNTLALSSALQAGDVPAFVRQVQDATVSGAPTLVVTNPDGVELLRTGTGADTAAGPGKPVAPPMSSLVVENGHKFVRIGIRLPSTDPQRPAALTYELPAPVLIDVLRSQKLPDEWAAAIIDDRNVIISRSVDADRIVGQTATPDLRVNAVHDQGSWSGFTLDGVRVMSGYARTQLANWRVVVGAPMALVEQRLRRALFLLTCGALLLAGMSLTLAFQLARQIAKPLGELALAGEVLARGEVLAPVRTRLKEVASVGSALRSASIALRNRADALDAERGRLAAIIETVPVGLLIVNPDLTVVSGNAQMTEITGSGGLPDPISALRPLVLDLRMLDGSPVPAHALPVHRALAGEACPELECRLSRRDGSAVWLYLVAAPIRDRAGNVSAAVLAALNVEEVVRAREEKARSAALLEQQVAERTQQLADANTRLMHEIVSRTKAEAQLRQVQKMEAVGQLTSGIAHDFNNLLTVVIGCLDMLRTRLADDRARRLADSALDGAQRAAVLTARLLAFSRQQPLVPRTLEVNVLVGQMAELLRHTLGESINLRTQLDPALWLVHADPNQLENALLNLAVNAKDAIGNLHVGGELTVATSNVVLDGEAFVDVTAGDYACITVADTGAGMPPEVMARAFEPFFTTKPIGQGTGLGLSQVHGFVKQSGGHVEIASRTPPDPAHGCTITIYLPREQAEVPALAPPSPPAAARERAKVLVVEDEPGVRSLACEALEELGYAVVAAGDVASAIDVLQRSPDVALLFTDMVLPDLSGRSLAEEARRRRPDLPILFTSGHSAERILREGRLGTGEGLIEKPYTVRQLADCVADLLR